MSVTWLPGSAAVVADSLAEMFTERGIETVRDGQNGDVLRFPAHPGLWANGAAIREYPRTLQIDVRLGIAPKQTIIESVAGFGTEDAPALKDGMESFKRATLPVLLSAFFGKGRIVPRERWDIGGRKRLISLGPIGTRFGFPRHADGTSDMRFMEHFKSRLESQQLSPGTHWIRLYAMQMNGKAMANEVLLDNQVWPEMQNEMAAFDWPPSDDKTYDVRVFLVLRDAPVVIEQGPPQRGVFTREQPTSEE